ncbi:hypothetical protein BCR33DRAFT_769964 [Rhizoclosmatium globosum]|uniref:Chitinase n=1 Tax=Rhizoclosmatium globosum TaxID=329046 RepID=A0A1Y2BQL3_9FUNG|nr:hypothetical protein BCR33DRAFT_769964 [Rhizoclosmatium globosum]|eukprot:ORY37042.1 hypothetical protein BCR33DRAFT_769964 [Rhizoclosmatium globosum]
MINPLALVVAVSTALTTVSPSQHLQLGTNSSEAKLAALADNAATIPVNRVFLSFVAPDMVLRVRGCEGCGSEVAGWWVEVFLSMGGWNYNCFPYFYAKYSIAYFGTGPNYWKITQYGGGSDAGCTEANMWCYTCEPQSEGTTLSDFVVFPEPAGTASFNAAQAQVVKGAKGAAVTWHPEIVGGAQYTDPIDKTTVVTVPGNNYWKTQNRDPYQDLIYLAKDLGLDGVDLDYEEMWHADTFRAGSGLGPFTLDQTVYKYAAISYDLMNSIKSIYPSCKLSTAAGAAGAWSTNWWGGNLKGLWYYTNLWFPDVINFMATGANAGGINVMTYDLSDNNQYYECPSGSTSDCDLAGQVQFYMNTYTSANIPARVGYEIGQPAYPDPTNDPTHQIPLTQAALNTILSGVSSTSTLGGFFWELYKPKNSAPTGATGQPNNIDATTLAQQVCAKILPNAARCKGVIPDYTGGNTTTTAVVVPPTTTTAVVVPPTTTAVVVKTTTTAAVVKTTTTAAVVKTTTTAVVVKTTTTAAVKTTTTAAVKTTTQAAGGNTAGSPCTNYGGWACSNSLVCSYGSAGTLVWVQVGTVASC